LLSVTSRVLSMLLIQDPDPVGRTCEDIFGAASVFSTMLKEGIQRKKVFRNRQWKWQIPGEPSRWFSITSHLLRSEYGSVSGIGFIIRDITTQKLLEEQMRDKEHLAALGELSAGIAHEIRNPLGVIRGNADLLMEEISSTDQVDLVKEIKNEIDTLNRIIQDFLKFARPAKLNVSSIDISGLIQEMINEFKAGHQDRIQFFCTSDESVGYIDIDESLIRQVIYILLDNAVTAISGKGKIETFLETIKRNKQNGDTEMFVHICIVNTGKKIPSVDFDKIFKPFYTTKPGGTGLGLAIAKKLVLLHNGFIEFDTQKSSGAAVKIMLPINYDPDRTVNLKGF